MLTIRLLGRPGLEREGRPLRPPRGRKSWALLGYLLLAERPQSRKHLAELLFGDADDPLGALRWTLAELRRALDVRDALAGDPVIAGLDGRVRVDVVALMDIGTVPEGDGELLDGLQLPLCLEFESWLLVARHRVSATAEARLREQALSMLAGGQARDAVRPAQRAVARNALDEGNHELLVRCLAVAGDQAAALRQVAVCEDLLRRELGVEPSPALRDAAGASPGSSMLSPTGGRGAALSQLEAGRAAIVAGAVDAGLQCLRRAVAESARCADGALQARALVVLGGALVHAVRGRDEEGAAVLHEGLALATEAGDRATAVTACRELGFIEVQAGRRRTADRWLARAQADAETDAELGAVLGVRGMNSSDMAEYAVALEQLTESVERAAAGGDQRQQAWSLSLLGRAHLLRGERSQAAAAVDRSLQVVQEQRWIAFLPWPQTLSAELDLQAGDLEGAAHTLEQAWVLACQVGDPCWEGAAARGLGLVHVARGDDAAADGWLVEAQRRCSRTPDRYQWIRAYVLDAAAAAALDRGEHDRARPLVTALAELAARCELREMVVRSYLHRHRLGDNGALPAARLLGTGIENPALTPLLAGAESVRG